MKKVFISAFLIMMIFTFAYGANNPLEVIKGPIEKGIAILKDSQYKDKKELQREKIWEAISSIFDFKAVSMRSLARNWKKFNKDQREKFVKEFTELLKNTYIDKIQGEFHDEQVVFEGYNMKSKKKAVVKSKVLRGDKEIPLDYSVYLKNGKWKVYDIKIEGVSLVKNYRNQFKTILSKETPDQLIDELKEKNLKNKKNRKIKNQ